MTLPNFLIIGAAKTGTTSLYSYLGQHPEIYLSPVKGPHFFSFEGQAVAFQGPGDARKINRAAITDLVAYQALFEGVESETAVGEISVLYLYFPSTPTRIRQYLPDVKLIAILRNPVDRAYSSFLHLVRDGREPLEDFSRALADEEDRMARRWGPIWYYKALGFYYEQLKRYYDLFSRDQIRVYLYDDLARDPKSFLVQVFRFLEVDDSFLPDLSVRHNVSGFPRSRTLHGLLTKSYPVIKVMRPFLPMPFRKTGAALLSKLRTENLVKPELAVTIRLRLLEMYRRDILTTQQLVGRDLSSWLVLEA